MNNRPHVTTARVPVALLAAVLVAAGCASREPLPELLAARAAVDRAASDPDGATAGSIRLNEARKELAAAEEATREREDEDLIRDRAFAATRNAEIALEQSAEARARRAVEAGEAERNRVLLESRTREAAAARAEANANRASAELSAEDADRARRQLEELRALEAQQTDRGMVLTLGDVLFETNRAVVKPGARENIGRVARFLSGNEGVRVIVEGHTDSRGSDAYNEELSRRRADAVRDELLSAGVDASRITAVGRGEAYPVASNDNAAGQQQNRRVEIVFSDEGGTFAQSSRNSAD